MKAREWIERLPEQFVVYEIATISPNDYKGIVFTGMGGSGIVGDVLKLFLEKGWGKGSCSISEGL